MRESGILMPVSSLPGPYGIGCFGAEAVRFVDFLAAAGQTIWQILPLSPTGYGDSPYQSCSAFAGNPYFIDLEALREEGLLTESQLEGADFGTDPCCIDYGALYNSRYRLLRAAYGVWVDGCAGQHGCKTYYPDDYYAFTLANEDWLDDYALYMAIKSEQKMKPWTEWPEEYRLRDPQALARYAADNEEEIGFWKFLQYMFSKQWQKGKAYANRRGIQILGDRPIYVSADSVEAWVGGSLFELDHEGKFARVAGVPPDYFAVDGQMWGNPLYNWKAHKKDGYRWWIARVRHLLDQADYVRIDHFRGFESYWEIPADAENAISGVWRKGPGEELFRAVHKALGEDLPIFAEDLGLITPEVVKLRDALGFPGMRVLQFAFDGGESTFLPHQFDTRNCICYTGTHDNNTTVGWYNSAPEYSRDKVRRYMNTDASSISWDFIRICLGSIARYAIFPVQDILKLGEEARMNVPGVADGNWAWRYRDGDLNSGMAQGLRQMTELFGR